MHAQPRRERESAFQLVAMLPDLGHSRLAADHRHDALVLVLERPAALALHVGEDVLRCPVARLLGDAPELRQAASSPAGMFAKSPSA